MQYREETEQMLSEAKEKVSDAADILMEILPEAAEELKWMCENLREEILSVRTSMQSFADRALGMEGCI